MIRLPPYVLYRWRLLSEEQIAATGPEILEYYKSVIRPQLREQTEEPPKSQPTGDSAAPMANRMSRRRTRNYPSPEDCAFNRLRTRCFYIGFKVRRSEKQDLLKRAAAQNVTLSEFLRRQVITSQDKDY